VASKTFLLSCRIFSLLIALADERESAAGDSTTRRPDDAPYMPDIAFTYIVDAMWEG